ncbi:endothelin-converting enzyme-like 1 [Amblyomma americanum]
MLNACLAHTSKTGESGVQELRSLMATINLTWPDPPDDSVSPVRVLLRLGYSMAMPLWFSVRPYKREAGHCQIVHISLAESVSFAFNQHMHMVQSKKYSQYYLRFYERFQQFGNKHPVPSAAVINRSELVENFILRHLLKAEKTASVGPACFPMTALDAYTRNISSDEWVAEMHVILPRAMIVPSDKISVSDLSLIRTIGAIFESYTRREILDHLGWQFAQTYGPLVDSGLASGYFGDAEQDYLPHACATHVESSYPGLPAAIYFLVRFERTAQAFVRQTLESVINMTASMMEGVTWLDETTRAAAGAKLRGARTRLWPPEWLLEPDALHRTYSSFAGNATSVTEFLTETRRSILALREAQPAFEEVLALRRSGSLPYLDYDYALNEVAVAAGSVRFPLFVPGGTGVMAFGGLGSSFALQLVRSLDSTGRSALADWNMGEPDGTSFVSSLDTALRNRSSCLKPAYGGDFFPEVVALEATHAAFLGTDRDTVRLMDHFSDEQVFFIAFCYFACKRNGAAAATQFFDCNKAVSHFPPFKRAFGCSPGSAMSTGGSCSFF